MSKEITVDIYKDASGDWRWRATTENGTVVADSEEGYFHRMEAIETSRDQFPDAVMVDETGNQV